ncbi:hypothetical protein [Aphanothece sacrum]|uniref:Translation factor Sua5 n=1 Tax=Aphanothece sacrum FPU1 TaxID=1920663 RepID=A0A401IIU8_APHSA|nr:hypothetical protein [Aphanothece sacrum]GBF81223.1 translation factor Sua5 [Aphanothece sacrum FPU1]GBF83427.1 translation factor Sua5 [Aphanothece sacrum FPU3]
MNLKLIDKSIKRLSLVDWLLSILIMVIVITIALYNLLENPQTRIIRQAAEKNLRLFARGNSLNALKCEGIDKNKEGLVICEATDRKDNYLLVKCSYLVETNTCQKVKSIPKKL